MNRTSALSRRSMLQRCGMGLGMLGLAGVLDDEGLLAADALADRALNPMAPQRPHFAPKAKRGDLALHQRWAQPHRYLGPQARTRETPRSGTRGIRQVHRLLLERSRRIDEVAVPVFTARPERQDGVGVVPSPWRACRQDGLHPLGSFGLEQPLAGAVYDQQRADAHGFPVSRLVGRLRAW